MKLSKNGLNLIKAFEGCLKPVGDGRFKAYLCPAGVLTIGWGHTNHHGRQFTSSSVWTQAECDAALAEDMAGFEKAVDRLVKVPINQRQFDALVSFAYNCGEGNLAKSTLLKRINADDFDGAAKEFHKWNKGGGRVLKGLVRRRASESLLFQGIADDNYDGIPDGKPFVPGELMPQKIDVPPVPPAPVKQPAIVATTGGALATLAASTGASGKTVVAILIAAVIVAGVAYAIARAR